MRQLSCGAKTPLDCLKCPYDDCICSDAATAAEGRILMEAHRKHWPTKAKTSKATTTVNYSTKKPVKSLYRYSNYEYLFY